MAETYCICELCREQVDPADPNVVRAVEMREVVAMGPTYHRVPGRGVLFHREHFPSGSPDYDGAGYRMSRLEGLLPPKFKRVSRGRLMPAYSFWPITAW